MRRFARFSGFAVAGLVTLVAGSLSACAPDTSAPILQTRVAPLPTSEAREVVAVALAEATPSVLVFEDQACLDCHIDQARLTELAQPVESHESLSSGPG